MTDNAVAADQDPLRVLLEEQGIQRVAIVDDAFDPIEVQGLLPEERESLWAAIEFDEDVQDEFARLQLEVNTAYDVTNELIARLVNDPSQSPLFIAHWDNSEAAQRMNAGLSGVKPLVSLLRDTLNVEVGEFESTVEPDQLIDYDPQLLFLDWHLGNDASSSLEEAIAGQDLPTAVQAATEKALKVLRNWPDEKARPLIVLISSRPSMPQDAGDFCRRSRILRGMFHAVSKDTFRDSFSLRMHLYLFARSLPEGRRIQTLLDALRGKFQIVRDQFLDEISDLSLNDYSYIQSLTLQNDGQPLGDYLQQLFSSHLGQLLFAEALGDEWADLDSMTFGEALPSFEPPSDRLTKVYHTALFDTSVGPIQSHPLAAETSDSAAKNLPVLALGDILKRESTNGDASYEKEAPEPEQQLEDGDGIAPKPDLFLLINAQCDLAFRPDSPRSPEDDELSILLLPGYFGPLDSAQSRTKPKTELYQHDGESHRIAWDIKRVLAIPHDRFFEWQEQERYARVARLRLPYALEIQRAFAADLTRVGTPVTPPIYQRVTTSLLLRHATERAYATEDSLREEEAAFLVLTKAGQKCILTFPLLARLKKLLDDKLASMRRHLREEGDNSGHLENQIGALERAIANEREWAKLQAPIKLPGINSPRKFFNDRIRIAQGAKVGDTCKNKDTVVAVSLDLDEVTTQ